MKYMTIPILLISIILIFPDTTRAIEIRTERGFTITLPDEWSQIPDETLKAYLEKIYQMAPDMKRQNYDYGFQLSINPDWFTYPYILIQVNNSGRITENRLIELAEQAEDLIEGASKAENALHGVLSEMDIGNAVYDEEFRTLFSTMSAEVTGIGRIKGLIAVILTNRGSINFFGYALEEEYDLYSILYTDVVHQIVFDPKLEYKPRLTDGIPILSSMEPHQLLITGLAGCLTIGLLLLVLIRKRS